MKLTFIYGTSLLTLTLVFWITFRLQRLTDSLDRPEWGPDGYGWQHLSKEDRLFVDSVSAKINPTVWNRPEAPFFVLDYLAFPQYRHFYQLTKEQFQALQDYCRLKLIDPVASKEVKAHWQSIADGTVPFGLTVQE